MASFYDVVAGAILRLLGYQDRHVLPGPLAPLALRVTSVSAATASIHDVVEIKWDYDSPELLASQAIQLHRLTFEGAVTTKTIGCLPQALLHAGQMQRNCTPLGLDQRVFQFEFNGPVTVHLIAEESGGRILQKYITLTLPDMSFSATVTAEQADYPRLGGVTIDGARTLSFVNCFGIYESTRPSAHDMVIENGLVDALEGDDFRRSFSADAPFFLSSTSQLEAQHFRPALGRAFPKLLADFFVRSQGHQFDGVKEFADTIIIGLGLAINGTVEVMPTAKGDCNIITSTVIKDLEPIFFQIDTRSQAQDHLHPVICNLHLGNIPQGLVFATFHGDLSWQGTLRTGNASIVTIEAPPGSVVRSASGQIKDGKVGNRIVFIGNPLDQELPITAVIDASWSKVPVFPDTDISRLLETQYRLQ
jgi:hypothetical protein